MSISTTLSRAARKARHVCITDRRKGFELIEIETLRQLLKTFSVDCVFDVGANAGQYASLLRQKVGYQGLIISFEPLPRELAILRQRSRNDQDWHIEPTALSNTDGTAQFRVSFGSEFSSLSAPLAETAALFSGAAVTREVIDVQTELLATALARLQLKFGFIRPFLKLDTQGHDHQIITAGQPVLPTFVGIQTELAVRPLYESSVSYLDALRDYEALGFRPCALFPNNFGHFPHLHEIDCVLLRADLI